MPGFEPPSSGQKLDFSETAYAGLEVTMDAISLGELLDIQDLVDAMGAGAATGSVVREMCGRFADALESWNVTRNGEPVPATIEGVLSQDASFLVAIIGSWQQGMAAAPPPLPGGSGSGVSSAEESTLGLAGSSRSLRS